MACKECDARVSAANKAAKESVHETAEYYLNRINELESKIHTGHPDCCADCELQSVMKLGSTPVAERSKKRTWFISYSWRSYSASMREEKSGFGNEYHYDFRGLDIAKEDIDLFQENMKIHHRPYGGNPSDVCEVIVLNIVEIGG